jgi:uncharacterized UBP type Zn finger protein
LYQQLTNIGKSKIENTPKSMGRMGGHPHFGLRAFGGSDKRRVLRMGKKKQKRGRSGSQQGGGTHLSSTRLYGLPNRGNTCYFNAVLQAVCSAPRLSAQLQSLHGDGKQRTASDQPLAAAFARLAISLDGAARGTRPTPPDQLLGAVRNRCPQFQGREQQDAQELYTMLLTGVAEEAAAAACNSDGTSSTEVEKMEAERLLGLVRSFLVAVRLLS